MSSAFEITVHFTQSSVKTSFVYVNFVVFCSSLPHQHQEWIRLTQKDWLMLKSTLELTSCWFDILSLPNTSSLSSQSHLEKVHRLLTILTLLIASCDSHGPFDWMVLPAHFTSNITSSSLVNPPLSTFLTFRIVFSNSTS